MASEARTNNITQRFATHLRISILLAMAAAVAWAFSAAAVAGGIADRWPGQLAGFLEAAAAMLTVAAVNFGAGYARKRIIVGALSELAAEQEQISAKVTDAIDLLDRKISNAITAAYQRGLIEGAQRVAVAAKASNGGRHDLDRTAYWQVYSEVMRDLGGVGDTEDGATAQN